MQLTKKNSYSIAPMMGKTDSYFCILLGLINKEVRIYTEMIHSEAIVRKNVLENYKKLENLSNISLQIAGNEPIIMAKAAKIAEDIGFKEININCGCPSPRVLSGSFGISLLKNPDLLSECVYEIKKRVSCEISVKTRIGINYSQDDNILDTFVRTVNKVNVKKYIIHARNAVINNFSTKHNLTIPSLNYERVFRLKEKFKKNIIIINGGFYNTSNYNDVLKKVDGIMIGREAYKNPWMFSYNSKKDFNYKKNVVLSYLNLLDKKFNITRFNFKSITHLYHIFNGLPGSKKWKVAINSSIKNKNIKCLINYFRYDI